MRTLLGFLLVMVAVGSLADDQKVPVLRISPDDIEQHSIQLLRIQTNGLLAVAWTYTEAGAKKVVAFREAHEAEATRVVIGEYEGPPIKHFFNPNPAPPRIQNDAQWKSDFLKWNEGFLKHRRDRIFTASEDEAKKIVDGLKKK
jgi:hypothetical protein